MKQRVILFCQVLLIIFLIAGKIETRFRVRIRTSSSRAGGSWSRSPSRSYSSSSSRSSGLSLSSRSSVARGSSWNSRWSVTYGSRSLWGKSYKTLGYGTRFGTRFPHGIGQFPKVGSGKKGQTSIKQFAKF